mmetsp:Transcript_567/g.717  ORF Transcript_567/g.717 Transcript_567/m.717 type:complete len:202 (-) Transcript_567:728-1333(-)
MSILAHLGDKDARVAALLVRELLHSFKSSLVLALAVIVSLLNRLLAVSTSDDRVFSDVASINVLKGKADLANGSSELGCLHRESKEVALASLSGLSKRLKSSLASFLVAASLRRADSLNLLPSYIVIVDLEHIEVLLLAIQPVLVDTDDHLSTRIDLSLATCGSLLNAHLRHTRDDSLGHATKILNFINNLLCLSRKIMRQ